MPALLAHAIQDSTDIFEISGGGGWTPPNHPPRYATDRNTVLQNIRRYRQYTYKRNIDASSCNHCCSGTAI